MRLVIFGLMSLLVGCGYMDDDLLVDDDAYEASFGSEVIGLSGYSSVHSGSFGYGCGGGHGTLHHRHRRVGIGSASLDASELQFLMLDDMHISGSVAQEKGVEVAAEKPKMVDGWMAVFAQMSGDREAGLRTAFDSELQSNGQSLASVE